MKIAALALGALALAAPSAQAAENLNAAGASFPAPIYQKWFQDYAAKTGNQGQLPGSWVWCWCKTI